MATTANAPRLELRSNYPPLPIRPSHILLDNNVEAVTIGRDSARNNQMDSQMKQNTVSRMHARLEYHDGKWSIADAGSMNGVSVNGERVTTPRELKDAPSVIPVISSNIQPVVDPTPVPMAEINEDRVQRDSRLGGAINNEAVSSALTCCICFEDVMVYPVSTTCGHSFCAMCLWQWVTRSLKPKPVRRNNTGLAVTQLTPYFPTPFVCPQCRTAVSSPPVASFTLLNMIDAMYGSSEEYTNRKEKAEKEMRDLLHELCIDVTPAAHHHHRDRGRQDRRRSPANNEQLNLVMQAPPRHHRQPAGNPQPVRTRVTHVGRGFNPMEIDGSELFRGGHAIIIHEPVEGGGIYEAMMRMMSTGGDVSPQIVPPPPPPPSNAPAPSPQYDMGPEGM